MNSLIYRREGELISISNPLSPVTAKEKLQSIQLQPGQVLVIWLATNHTPLTTEALGYYYSTDKALEVLGHLENLTEDIIIEVCNKEELGFTGWFEV